MRRKEKQKTFKIKEGRGEGKEGRKEGGRKMQIMIDFVNEDPSV